MEESYIVVPHEQERMKWTEDLARSMMMRPGPFNIDPPYKVYAKWTKPMNKRYWVISVNFPGCYTVMLERIADRQIEAKCNGKTGTFYVGQGRDYGKILFSGWRD